MFTYIDAIIVDTPILDSDYRNDINNKQSIASRLSRAERFISYLDAQWEIAGIRSEAYDWKTISSTINSDIEFIRSRNMIVPS